MKPITVLFLAADPFKQDALSLDEEIRAIDQKIQLSPARGVKLVSAWAVRPDDIRSALLRHAPDVVHFSGHGTSSGSLVLQGDDTRPHPVSTRAIAELLGKFKSHVRLVVLNACFSSTEAEAVSKALDFSIGMNAAIGDHAARCFSAAFYETLAAGKSVQMAFDLGCNAVAMRGLNEDTEPQLYVRDGLTADVLIAPPDVSSVPKEGTSVSHSPSPVRPIAKRDSAPKGVRHPVVLAAAIAGVFGLVAAVIQQWPHLAGNAGTAATEQPATPPQQPAETPMPESTTGESATPKTVQPPTPKTIHIAAATYGHIPTTCSESKVMDALSFCNGRTECEMEVGLNLCPHTEDFAPGIPKIAVIQWDCSGEAKKPIRKQDGELLLMKCD